MSVRKLTVLCCILEIRHRFVLLKGSVGHSKVVGFDLEERLYFLLCMCL